MRQRTVIITIAVSAVTLAGGVGKALAQDDGSPSRPFPTNQAGETYGSQLGAKSANEVPDLIEAIGVDGNTGYVKRRDLDSPIAANPQEAVAQMSKTNDLPRFVPLYERDGKTVIGSFQVG